MRPDGKTQVTFQYLQQADGSMEPLKIHTQQFRASALIWSSQWPKSDNLFCQIGRFASTGRLEKCLVTAGQVSKFNDFANEVFTVRIKSQQDVEEILPVFAESEKVVEALNDEANQYVAQGFSEVAETKRKARTGLGARTC